MRVLLNALFSPPKKHAGAVKTVTEALFLHLAEAQRKFDVKLMMAVSETSIEHWSPLFPDIEPVLIPYQSQNRFLRVGLEQLGGIHWAVRRCRADVYYSSSGILPILPLPCQSVVFLQNLIWFHHDEFYPWRSLSFLRERRNWAQQFQNVYSGEGLKHSLRLATEVIAVSETVVNEVKQHAGIPRKRPFHVIPCGVNGIFQPENTGNRPFEAPYIVSVSSLVKHKNYEDAILIFADFKRRYQLPHSLCLLGGGDETYVHSLKALAEGCQVGDSVHFMGHVANELLPSWYAHADAFLLTSACESFGLPIIEAMSSGTPVLAARRSGLIETVGDAGILEEPSAHHDFADHLYRVLTDDSLKASLRAKGLAHAASFSWHKVAEDTYRVLRLAVEGAE